MNKDNQQIDKPKGQKPMVVSHMSASFSGPLPPPSILQKYNEVCPGAADRIVTMAEKQSEHRRSIEKQVITSDTKNSRIGLFCGCLIGLAGIIGATIVAIYGKQIFAGFLSALSIGSLVGTFVYGSKIKTKEREKQRE